MTKTILHVNRRFIAKNLKDGGSRPTLIVRNGRSGKPRYCREARWSGQSRMVQAPDVQPLSCGARAYVVIDGPVELVDEMTFEQANRYSN